MKATSMSYLLTRFSEKKNTVSGCFYVQKKKLMSIRFSFFLDTLFIQDCSYMKHDITKERLFILNSSQQHCLRLEVNNVLVHFCRSKRGASLQGYVQQSLISAMEVNWQVCLRILCLRSSFSHLYMIHVASTRFLLRYNRAAVHCVLNSCLYFSYNVCSLLQAFLYVNKMQMFMSLSISVAVTLDCFKKPDVKPIL